MPARVGRWLTSSANSGAEDLPGYHVARRLLARLAASSHYGGGLYRCGLTVAKALLMTAINPIVAEG